MRRILLLLLALWSFDQLVTLSTEAQWMAWMGFTAVWRTQIITQVMLFGVTLLTVLGGAMLFLRPLARAPVPNHNATPAYRVLAERMFIAHQSVVRVAWIVVVALALCQAVRLAIGWQDWLLFMHGQPWSLGETVLGREAGFYVFRLSWWHRVLDVLWSSATLTLALVALLSVTRCILLLVARELHGALLWMRALRPLLAGAALWFAVRAAGYYLEPLDIVASASQWEHGSAASLLLIDRITSRVGLTACLLMSALCLLPAVAASVTLPVNSRLPAFGSGARRLQKWRTMRFVVVVCLCALLIPTLAFRFAQLAIGTQTRAPDIAVTDERHNGTVWQRTRARALRTAWNLDAVQNVTVEIQSPTVEPNGTAALGGRPANRSATSPSLPHEVPLWDVSQLGEAARVRLATVTTADITAPLGVVHMDRYMRDGQPLLVGIAGREAGPMRSGKAPEIAVFSASQVSRGRTPVSINLSEASKAVSSDEAGNAAAGRSLPWWQRLLWAWRLRDLSLLHAAGNTVEGQQFTRSNLLFRRSMPEWAQHAAPFLVPHGEPYPVVTPTGVVWILDLLSATARFPLVASTQRGTSLQGYNAARDSVKMTRDAKTGQVAFYTAGGDEPDPLLEPWRRAFPSLVKPWHEMPAFLRRHCRYPRALFEVQRDALRHSSGTTAKSDPGTATYSLWPAEDASGELDASGFVLQGALQQGAMKKDVDSAEIAVLIAHCDENVYGRLRLFRFRQRRAQAVSTRAALSSVLPGGNTNSDGIRNEPEAMSTHHVLVPIGSLRPARDRGEKPGQPARSKQNVLRLLRITVQYEAGAGVPRIKRVLVADALDTSQRLGSGTDLEQAWRQFWGESVTEKPRTVNELAGQALSTHEKVQRAASAGDWTGFDVHRKKLRDVLLELQARSRQREETSQVLTPQSPTP